MSMTSSLREHWLEYLIEGWALGSFMAVIGSLVTALESPKSPIYSFIPSVALRMVLLALTIGMALALLIQSPWRKRSGAHMNPAITLAFLRLKKIQPWDALFYVLAQITGGTLGVVLVAFFTGSLFEVPPKTGPPITRVPQPLRPLPSGDGGAGERAAFEPLAPAQHCRNPQYGVPAQTPRACNNPSSNAADARCNPVAIARSAPALGSFA